jgi:hypothetical protein
MRLEKSEGPRTVLATDRNAAAEKAIYASYSNDLETRYAFKASETQSRVAYVVEMFTGYGYRRNTHFGMYCMFETLTLFGKSDTSLK